jgi:hypothetical protein
MSDASLGLFSPMQLPSGQTLRNRIANEPLPTTHAGPHLGPLTIGSAP